MILNDVRALFIDVGGTMLAPRLGVGCQYALVARVMGIAVEPEELERRFYDVFQGRIREARREGRLAYGRTEGEALAFWRGAIFDVFAPWSPPEDALEGLVLRLWDHFTRVEAWEVYADVVPVLEVARGLGLPVVVVSNWDARLPRLLHDVRLTPYFHGVIASFMVGAEKPSPLIFQAALDLVDAAAGEVLHVGDSLSEDFTAARAVGLRALHLDRLGLHSPAGDRISSLAELI